MERIEQSSKTSILWRSHGVRSAMLVEYSSKRSIELVRAWKKFQQCNRNLTKNMAHFINRE